MRRYGLTVLCFLAMWAAGCASTPRGDALSDTDNQRVAATATQHSTDPWQSYNRAMTKFNNAVDDAVILPVARAYSAVLPQPVRTGIGNFFGNLGDVWSLVNNILQGKGEGALHSFWRVVINSTVGLGGFLDPATDMRLEKHPEDFGQTLGRWGAPPGPYLVLPFLGSSSVRDGFGFVADFYGRPQGYLENVRLRNSLTVLQYIDLRAQLADVGDLLEQAALDPYAFQRDAWLQKRQNDVYDGNPPVDDAAEAEDDVDIYDDVDPDASADSP